MSHLPGLFPSFASVQTSIATAISGIPLGELPQQVHLDIAAAVQALPAGSTPAQVQAAITTALAGQPVGELPTQVHADIAAAVAALPAGATPAQVTAAITSATSGLATVAQVNALRVVPVPSTAAPVAATAFPDVTGTSYTMTQLAALISSIILTGGGAYTGTLGVAQPTLSRIYQRDTRTGSAFGKGAGTVGLSVTLSAPVVTLDCRLRDADAAGNPVRQDWTALAGAEPAGTVALSPSVPASASRYLIDVRANGDTAHAVLGTQAFSVGEVTAISGQSLATDAIYPVNNDASTTLASLGIVPSPTSAAFASYDGNLAIPSSWQEPADGGPYASAYAAEFLRVLGLAEGVPCALVGYAHSGAAISTWAVGAGSNNQSQLKAVLTAAGGRFGSFVWVQGHTDASNAVPASTWQAAYAAIVGDLASSFPAVPFVQVLTTIPSITPSTQYPAPAGSPQNIQVIRGAAEALAAAQPARIAHVETMDAPLQPDGIHPTQAGMALMGRQHAREVARLHGVAASGIGPIVTAATRSAGSGLIKLMVANSSPVLVAITNAAQQGGATASTPSAATLAQQFGAYVSPLSYSGSAPSNVLAISGASIVSATEIDLALAAVPADGVAVDVVTRMPWDIAGTIATGIYDGQAGDGLPAGRQLRVSGSPVTAAAPVPATAPPLPSPVPLLSFAGPAGVPTGNAVMVGLDGSVTGYGLDGSGNFLLPPIKTSGVFPGLGNTKDGLYTATFAANTPNYEVLFVLRATSASATAAWLWAGYANKHWGIYAFANGAYVSGLVQDDQAPHPAPTTSISVELSGSTVTLYRDGAALMTHTGTDFPQADGLFGLCGFSPTPAPALVASVTYLAAAPTSDGTLTGLPSTIAAGQPLSAVTYTPPQTSIYFVLYKVAGAVEEGLRWASGVMPGALNLLIPQTAGAYTVRAYDAATGGNKVYESAQFTVTAAPGALPATPTQTADTGATSSGVTMSWTATGSSYRMLARSGIGSVYGSLADTTVSTNSYTFTGRPANSSPRAVVIAQNANGYGTPTGQFLSFTTA